MKRIVAVFALCAMVVGCAGTSIKQKSLAWDLDGDGKSYMSSKEILRGEAEALFAELNTGAMSTYVEVDESGYIIDMTGQARGADSTAALNTITVLGIGIAKLFAPPQLLEFNQAIEGGASASELAALLMEASADLEPLVEE